MALDHGQLNVPGRTNTINRDIDRFKAARAAEQRTAAKQRHDLRTVAKAAVAALSAERVGQLAQRLGVTPARARKDLARAAHWTPALCLKALVNDERRA